MPTPGLEKGRKGNGGRGAAARGQLEAAELKSLSFYLQPPAETPKPSATVLRASYLHPGRAEIGRKLNTEGVQSPNGDSFKLSAQPDGGEQGTRDGNGAIWSSRRTPAHPGSLQGWAAASVDCRAVGLLQQQSAQPPGTHWQGAADAHRTNPTPGTKLREH